MQKIDKNQILSKKYLMWLEKQNGKHPEYKSSWKYVKDIKMSLLYSQKGLCAYTEELLCDIDLITPNNWNDEKYITKLDNENLINGDLEHFDCRLKDDKAYLWDNLFMVNSNINCRVKKDKTINHILKPDSNKYDVVKYLQFDDKVNRFKPNKNLSHKDKKDVLDMIETLGINRNAFKRANQIKNLKEDFDFNSELKEPIEYITSWKMTLENLQNTKK